MVSAGPPLTISGLIVKGIYLSNNVGSNDEISGSITSNFLERISFSEILLGDLKIGEWTYLTEEEENIFIKK